MRYLYSFLRTILIFSLLGPVAGTLHVAAMENLSAPETGYMMLWGFVFGIIPASIAGLINWVVILLFYLAKNDNYFWPGVALAGISPMLMLSVADGHVVFSWYFFGICIAATILCAFLTSHKAWYYLCNS